jgi:hypothetical protein
VYLYLLFIIMKRKQTKEEFNRELIDCMKSTMYNIYNLYMDYRKLVSIYIDINWEDKNIKFFIRLRRKLDKIFEIK